MLDSDIAFIGSNNEEKTAAAKSHAKTIIQKQIRIIVIDDHGTWEDYNKSFGSSIDLPSSPLPAEDYLSSNRIKELGNEVAKSKSSFLIETKSLSNEEAVFFYENFFLSLYLKVNHPTFLIVDDITKTLLSEIATGILRSINSSSCPLKLVLIAQNSSQIEYFRGFVLSPNTESA